MRGARGLVVPSGGGTGGGITNINVSAGATSNNLSNLVFDNSPTVTFGLNGSTITASAAAGAGGGAALQGSGAYSQNSGTIQFANSNGITFGLSTNQMTASVNSTSNVGLNTAQTNVTWTVNSGGISLNASGYLTTAMASNRASDFVAASAAFAGTSASGTIASNGLSISIGPYITTAMQSNAATISNINVSGGTTSSNLSALNFVNSNGVSWSLDTASKLYATVKTDYLTTAMASNRGTDFVQANAAFAGTSASGTIASNGISVSIGPYITTAMLSNASTISNIKVSAGTSSTNLSALTFDNAGGITFGLSGSVITAAAPAGAPSPVNFSAGTTSGNLASIKFVDSNGISFGLNSGGSSQSLTATVKTAYMGLGTAQTNVTWTANSDGLSFNAEGYAGTSTGFTGTNISASMTHNTLGLALRLNVAAGGAVPNRSFFEIIDGQRLTTAFRMTQTQFTKRPIFQPFWLDGQGMSVKTVRFLISADASSNTLSMNFTHGVGFYSLVNSTSLALVSSTTNAVSLTASSEWSGVRFLDITGLSNMTMSEGRWIMAYYLSASNNSSAVANFRLYGADPMPNFVGTISAGTDQTVATNASSGPLPFWGVYSNTTTALPANVGKSDMSMANSGQMQDVYAVIMQIS